jgi:NAD(P)-dependent dehydrogenase (short-subunit alcohol dehydrogenase family)
VVDACRRAGANAVAVQADVSVEADVVRLFETVDRELSCVTALVNNAGILER